MPGCRAGEPASDVNSREQGTARPDRVSAAERGAGQGRAGQGRAGRHYERVGRRSDL